MLGLSLYGLAHLYQLASTEPIIKHTKKCKYCRQRINEKVRGKSLDVQQLANEHSLRDASTARAGSMEERINTNSNHDTHFRFGFKCDACDVEVHFHFDSRDFSFITLSHFYSFLTSFTAFLRHVVSVRAD